MFEKWITLDWHEFPMVILSGVATYAAILMFTRMAGLRSFSKLTAADFAVTVAIGSLFASTVSSAKPPLLLGLIALASLYAGQKLVAWLRMNNERFGKLIDNEPLLLMAGETFIEENLRRANVTKADIFGKLREANAINYAEILAVVLETTGDISVLHTSDSDSKLERDFMKDVVGSDQLFDGARRDDDS